MSDKAYKMLTKARANLIMSQPFFGTLALRLKLVEDTKIDTVVTDGVNMRYNPAYVDKLTLDQACGMLAHTVMHPALLHHTRRGERDVKKWNEACDYSINTLLKNSGFTLPEDKFVDPKYNGMTAEHIYTLLPTTPPQGGKGKGKGGGSGQGEDDSNGGGSNDPGGNGGVEDSPECQNNGGSSAKQQCEENEWKIAVSQAAHVAKQQGKLPGDMERMMAELMESKIPWRDQLRRFMTEKAHDDYTWSRPNRRFIAQGLVLPSRHSEGTGEIVVCIDTSGSIGEKELNEFGSEIRAIRDDVRPSKTHVVYCDAQINHVDTFGPDDELILKPHGGGGTDFRPPFKWVAKQSFVPKCLIYLTDGYGPFPEEEPEFPVMWCINNHDVVPPSGEHLILDV